MVEMNSLMQDERSRDRIVGETERNFFVEAGAGSGKTTMLVKRMVAMVEAGTDITKISAITFTKAAAGEFYKKFQEILIERSNPDYEWKDEGEAGQLPEPTEETRKNCEKALQNIDLCFMGTIDSFCKMILSEHPYEAGISADADIISDEEAEAFYLQQFVDICNGKHGEDLLELAKIFQSFYREPERVFSQGIKLLMDNRNAVFDNIQHNVVDIDATYAKQKQNTLAALKVLCEHPDLQYKGNQYSAKAWEQIDRIRFGLGRSWNRNLSNLRYNLEQFDSLQVVYGARKAYGPVMDRVFVQKGYQSSPFLKAGSDKALEEVCELQYSISMRLLMECVPILEEAMKEKGYMTYFDCLYYLRNMLKADAGSGGKLIEHIYNRHSYFLIDEFQDTNPMQYEIFFYLTAENPVSNWTKCEPREGSLFIVGDPKQSIYRFRGADVTSFMRVKGLFARKPDSILTLSKNFRSTKTMCEYYNKVFRKSLNKRPENSGTFEDIPLLNDKPGEFQGVFKYKAYIGKAIPSHPEETDPKQICRIIQQIVGREKYKITTEKDETPRPIRYSDIMVVPFGKKKLGPIVAELDSAGIPSKVEGQVPFTENEALCEVAKIYAVAADSRDRAALYGALTGKLMRHAKEDILRYRAAEGKLYLNAEMEIDEENTEEAVKEVYKSIQELKKFRAKAIGLSPAALFASIMDEFRIFEKVDTDNLEVLYYILELLRNAEKTGEIVTLKDGSRFINARINGDSDEERCLSLDDTRDCVHLANLHKVKGLEAPVVILADAYNFALEATSRMQHGATETKGYIFKLRDEDSEKKTVYFKTFDYVEEAQKEKEALEAERDRQVYVAATRARNALIICENAYFSRGNEVTKTIWEPLLKNGGFVPDIIDKKLVGDKEDEDTAAAADAAALYEKAEDDCILKGDKDRKEEKETHRIEQPSKIKLAAKNDNPDTDDADDAPSEAHRYPGLLGSATHKLMEMFVTSGKTIDLDIAIDEIVREYMRPVYKGYESDLRKALNDVASRMLSGGYEQDNGLPTDILTTLLEADEVYCEVPFTYEDTSDSTPVIWNGSIDVLYSSEGQWHIIDYKTNADGSDLDDKYQGQLNAYQKAVKASTGIDADAKTYHIDI